MSQNSNSVIDFFTPDGIKTILFKCRQRKNLTGFIRKVLEIGSWDTARVHTDFRIHADF